MPLYIVHYRCSIFSFACNFHSLMFRWDSCYRHSLERATRCNREFSIVFLASLVFFRSFSHRYCLESRHVCVFLHRHRFPFSHTFTTCHVEIILLEQAWHNSRHNRSSISIESFIRNLRKITYFWENLYHYFNHSKLKYQN